MRLTDQETDLSRALTSKLIDEILILRNLFVDATLGVLHPRLLWFIVATVLACVGILDRQLSLYVDVE